MNFEPQLINQRLLTFNGIIILGKLAVKGILKHIKLGQNLESQFLWNGATFQQIVERSITSFAKPQTSP